MPNNVVNRRDEDYHHEQRERMTDLDLFAIGILALVHSRKKNKRSTQGMIHMDCVAVSRHGNHYTIASNRLRLEESDVRLAYEDAQMRQSRTGITVDIVRCRRNINMHAEMKIVSRFMGEHIAMAQSEIGVSKPCCIKCAQVLDRNGIIYSTSHTTRNRRRWVAPNPGQIIPPAFAVPG